MADTEKLTRKEKRDLKFARKPLSSFNGNYIYFKCPFSPRTFKCTNRFGITVIKNYLGIQFFQKWGFYKIPVVHVDHPLDKKIPFTPSKAPVYMDFVPLFLRPLTMLIKRYGIKRAAPFVNDFFNCLATVYKECGRMYRQTLSTTDRPHYKESFYFKVIHLFDPHLLCVPSLHIAIIVLTTGWFKKTFKSFNLSDAESFQRNTELYNRAVEIAESVLYMKQHSVNCVPAALYMITKTFPDIFTPNDATNFINDMFLTAETIRTEDCIAIRDHISFMYERFLLEGYAADDWRDPIARWIESYDAAAEQEAADKAEASQTETGSN